MKIELSILTSFIDYWNNETREEKPGSSKDVYFLRSPGWQQDAAVIDRITYSRGRWFVSLVFANPKAASSFIIRFIRSSISFKKAKVAAYFLRRNAAQDSRGTTKLTLEMFECPEN